MPNGSDAAGHAPAVSAKKAKQQQKNLKAVDSNASKLLKHRIAQLEQDAAGEKDQEAEIGEWTVQPRLPLATSCTSIYIILCHAMLHHALARTPRPRNPSSSFSSSSFRASLPVNARLPLPLAFSEMQLKALVELVTMRCDVNDISVQVE